MSQRSRLRLVVLQVLVFSLMITLFGRLYYLQVIAGDTYQQAADSNRIREVVTPATRGLILDDVGRPLAQNRTTLVVSVDRTAVGNLDDEGEGVLKRLAKTLGTSYADVHDQIQLCGTPGAKKPPVCWNGSPYQPIPVAKDVKPAVALAIMERSELYPGITAELEAVRDYPGPAGVNAAHVIGNLGPVTAAELKAQKASGRTRSLSTDLVGRAGLEVEYDKYLRGTAGVQSLAVDQAGAVEGTVDVTPSKPGDYLVTNIDAKLQNVVERELAAGVKRARNTPVRNGPGYYKADSAAAVVLDTKTGKVLALASYPTYDPNLWVGGVTQKELTKLYDPKAGAPLVSRATSGQYAPGSTFKVVSAAAAATTGSPFYGSYACPSSVQIGNRKFSNFESESLGTINLETALVKSCDTVFYQFAYDRWLKDGGTDPVAKPDDALFKMAKRFGFGRATGIDLPYEAPGLVADRAYIKKRWEQTKADLCAIGRGEVKGQTAYQRAIAAENCLDGYKLRAGDAVNFAIGQGDTLSTPIQLATTYAAIANGGDLMQPQVARAVVSPSGKVVKSFAPKVTGRLGIPTSLREDLVRSLAGVPVRGTAKETFAGFPLGEVPIAAKTGTSEGINSQPTAWFASFAPADKPRYAVVVVISQGGTGGSAAAPVVRKIYESLFGVTGSTVDPSKSALRGGKVPGRLPTVRKDGTVVQPTAKPKVPASPGPTDPATAGTPTSTRSNRRRPGGEPADRPRRGRS